MRIVTWQIAAALASLGGAGAAFALVEGPSRLVTTGVLGLAGVLALWPLPEGGSGRVPVGLRVSPRRRIRELEAELERVEAEREELAAALRGLDQWVQREALGAARGQEQEVASWN